MLEMFFDNAKVFSVFEQILKSGEEKVNMAELLYKMQIPIEDAGDILASFVFLGILEETKDTQDKGIFRFNPTSKIVLGLCFFDEIVGEYFFEKAKKDLLNNGEEDNDLFSLLKEKSVDIDIEKSDLSDFFEFLKENDLL